MSEQYIQKIGENIFQSCKTLFEERVVDNNLKQLLLQQLDDYSKLEPKDINYVRSLQFMYENWQNTLPRKQETSDKKEVVYFFKPREECFAVKAPVEDKPT